MKSVGISKEQKSKAIELGNLLGKIPLLFAKGILIGPRPGTHGKCKINNGTATLVDLGAGPMALTCHHVIQAYRDRLAKLQPVIFQIGDVELDPIAQLIDEDADIDLASIRLSKEQAAKLTTGGDGIASAIYQPPSWPVPTPKEGEGLTFGGFPGRLRRQETFDELVFSSWGVSGVLLSSVSKDRLICAFERGYWLASPERRHKKKFRLLGGTSGGPAFVLRRLHNELVGIITDFSKNYDTIFIASLSRLRADGTIAPPMISVESKESFR